MSQNPEETTAPAGQGQQYSPELAARQLLAQKVGQLSLELAQEQAAHTGTQIELQNASLALQEASRQLEAASQRLRELEGESDAAEGTPEAAEEGAGG